LFPKPDFVLQPGVPVDFSWTEAVNAALYQLEVQAGTTTVLESVVPASVVSYRAPPWLADRAVDGSLRWRVSALDFGGNLIGRTPWRDLRREAGDAR
jgi:hypothetical protein